MKNNSSLFVFDKAKLLLLFLGFLCHGYSQDVSPKKASLNGKNILFVYGGWEGHNPKASVDLMVPKLRAEGAQVLVVDNLSVYTDDTIMADIDLIIQNWTMGNMTQAQFEGLENAVNTGTGLAGWHGGLGDAFRDNLMYQFIVGGQFLFHPNGAIDYTVKIIDSDDPITQGINDFTVKNTEQYYMLIDPNIDVLAITEFDRDQYAIGSKTNNKLKGSSMPVVWKKNYGKGRVFYSSIGHNLSDFDLPEVMTMQMRGFRWASEGKYIGKEADMIPANQKKK